MMKFFKRLFCLHHWIKSKDVDDLHMAHKIGMVTPWRCDKCDERIFREWGWVPLNYYRRKIT